MKTTVIGIRMAVAGVIVLGFLGGSAALEHPGSSIDTRQRLTLAPAERDKILAEMRLMLGSISGIVQGLATDDLLAAEKAARASGMAVAADVDPQVEKLLPQPFLGLGVQTHRGFDTLADRIKAGGTQGDLLRGLAGRTGNCVSCHAAYRLDEAR